MALEDHKTYRIFVIINAITHFLIGGITVVCCVFAYNVIGSDHFKQHILLCVLGYILLMSEAIMTFSHYNGWSKPLSLQEKKITHLVLQIAGSALAITGSIIRINGYPGTSFSTAHGIFGWLAFIMTTLSLVGGVVNYYATKNGRYFKIGHSISGMVTLTLAVICLTIGVNKDVFTLWSSSASATTLTVFAIVALLGTFTTACPNLVRRIRS